MKKIDCPFPCSKLVKQSFGWMRDGIDEIEFFRRWKALLESRRAWKRKYQSSAKWRAFHRQYERVRRAKNPEKTKLDGRKSYSRHAEQRRADARAYRLKLKEDSVKSALHRQKVNLRKKTRYNTDIFFLIRRRLSGRIRMAISKEYRSGSALNLLGCSVSELKQYLQSNWLPGMSWENYGLRGWHIDHKKPCASFDLTSLEQQRACFHYSNLQPLWWRDNLSKGARA